jgi:hypothetical protein
MAEEAHAAHPPPPHHGPAAPEHPAGETSERIFRRRLVKALTTFNIKDMRAMWKEELLEPHMHLFVMLVVAFALGVTIWAVEPMLR